jgi:vesicle-fusing ATPase
MRIIRAHEIPVAAADRQLLMRIWQREAALAHSGLLVMLDETAQGEPQRHVAAFVERADVVLVLAGREPLQLPGCALPRFDVRKPDRAEQAALWRRALAGLEPQADDHTSEVDDEETLDSSIDRLVNQFNLGAAAIANAGGMIGRDDSATHRPIATELWEICRSQARARLDDLAQRVEAAAGWDDLVLPAFQKQILRDIVVNVRQRARVHDQWGFAAKSSRGLGISALFSGASGTGKTLAAEIMANELCLDLYRIDLSQVVSKYIGETEKNLRRVFDAAETAGAVLLFDEADALFGKRSEVKDSHDRYANIEVSYLLQRMEAYRGLAILTTNMKQALDPAFMRRIRFVVQFPFPDFAERAEIWKRVFPEATPTAELDVARLAGLNVSGGNIRNIALGAAFVAADENVPVTMAHLLRAARAEYAKLERPLTESEIGGWS